MLSVKFNKLEDTWPDVNNNLKRLLGPHLDRYNKDFPGAINTTDIFEPGIRSEGHPQNFDLFAKGGKYESVCVCPYYLEMFAYAGSLESAIEVLDDHFKLLVVQWNHDVDASMALSRLYEYDKFRVINFNTSKKYDQDIIVPFWNIDTSFLVEEKNYMYNFVGDINHQTRNNLVNEFIGDSRFIYANKLDFNAYRKLLSASTYTFCPRGAGLNSYRFYECMHLNTIPVLFADDAVLPYEDIDYNKICIRIPEAYSGDREAILSLLHPYHYKVDEMLDNIKEIRHRFTLKGVQEEVHRCLSKL